MSTEYLEYAHSQVRDLIDRLQSPPADLTAVLSLLAAPLATFGILPPALHRYNTDPLSSDANLDSTKHLPLLQRALLQHVIPIWEDALREKDLQQLLYQYFCPDSFYFATQVAGDVALCAYDTILSLQLTDFSIIQLFSLSVNYPIDRLHSAIYSRNSTLKLHKRTIAWEDCVRNAAAVPAKVANYRQGEQDIPERLQHGPYLTQLCVRFELLLKSLSFRDISEDQISSLAYLMNKMINIGLFPATPPTSPSQPSFFAALLPMIKSRLSSLRDKEKKGYISMWRDLWDTLSTNSFQIVLTSLLSMVTDSTDPLSSSAEMRGLIKREASLIFHVIGELQGEDDGKWQTISAVALGHTWSEAKARIFVCWVAGCDPDNVHEQALNILLNNVIAIWTSPEHIKHSLLSHHRYMTALLLVTLSYFPQNAPPIHGLAFSPPFISSVSTYIGHLDAAVRRCGMLVAEAIAQSTGKALDFGGWEGDGDGRPWVRKLRALVAHRDIDAVEAECDVVPLETEPESAPAQADIGHDSSRQAREALSLPADGAGYDSDDSLTGYASPTSSRSLSPTPSELEEVEKDPTLRVGAKKVQKPVYLADVGGMLRSNAKPDDPQEADRIEVALTCAEELIRKKKDYGLELEENAVNLVYALVGLQNNFELEGFDEKRQRAVNALVACCPRKAVPAIIEEFFKNQYSTGQRFVILNGLALGARELASLPIPTSSIAEDRTSFPSKRLPPALHKKYITDRDQDQDRGGAVQGLVADISRIAINSGKDATEDKVPALVRERQLRIKRPARVVDIDARNQVISAGQRKPQGTSFTELAAEYFLAPLIGRFWLFLRDEQAREERTAHRTSSYRGTGTGLILSPLVLAQFLATVTVLMHAARNSPAYLAILAPDALELAVTLGTRPLSTAKEDKEREAAVLTGSLELALVVLDSCLDLDGGRSLGLEHTALLLGAGEWAGQILNLLDSGGRVQGGGGVQEVRLKRAAAGVVLKVDEFTSKWRQSMITL